MREAINKCKSQIQYIIFSPKNILPFLQAGRLCHVVHNKIDYGWGAIVNYKKKKTEATEATNAVSTIQSQQDDSSLFIVDVVLQCSDKSSNMNLIPSEKSDKAQFNVVSVYLSCLTEISSVRIRLSKDLRTKESRSIIAKTINEVRRRFKDELPLLDPIKEIGIKSDDFVKLTQNLNRLQTNLKSIDLKSDKEEDQKNYDTFVYKRSLLDKQRQLTKNVKEAQEIAFTDTLQKMMRVLRRLSCLDDNDVITAKGRVACEINTADELLVTELIYEGVFLDLTPEQCLSLLASIVFQEKAEDPGRVRAELQKPYEKLKEVAKRIATVYSECKIDIDIDEYVAKFKPGIMEVIYEWVSGAKFAEICNITTIFEGTIIRCIRRLEELVEQVTEALHSIGDIALAKKFEEGSKKIKRDIVFAASLYI